MEQTNITKDRDNKTFKMERVFDAPLERVWRAWTSDEINQWWGPRGWATTSKHMDVTPGGYWLYCMKCVDKNQGEFFGQESCGKAAYVSVDPPKQFVYKDYFADADGNEQAGMPVMTITMDFTEENGKTRVLSTGVYETVEDFDKVIAMGVEAGATETWDRLAEYLSK